MDKILVTGGSGLLGSNIAKLSTPKFDVYATYNKNKVSMNGVCFFEIDLTKKDSLIKIKEITPDIIIHCAALANLDYCEGHPEEAYRQNVLASINVAEAAKNVGAYLIYISTDCVFNGENGGYSEEDVPDPINVYAETKLEAEQKVLSTCSNSCVVRTNIYGWNKIDKFSLAEWMLDNLTNDKKFSGLKDVYFSPMLVNDLAGILFRLYKKKHVGLLHVAGHQVCSKLDFAYSIAEVFNLDRNLIKSSYLYEIGLGAPRAKNTSLNVTKAEKILGEIFPNVKDGLGEMKRLRDQGYIEGLKHG